MTVLIGLEKENNEEMLLNNQVWMKNKNFNKNNNIIHLYCLKEDLVQQTEINNYNNKIKLI